MPIKLLKYGTLFFSLSLWVVGCHPDLVKVVYRAGWIEDEYRYGDLYRLANLPQFKQRATVCPPSVQKSSRRRPVHVYLIGDSFTEKGRMDSSYFNADYFRRIYWAEQEVPIQLDTAATNVLILETVERHFREKFAQPVRNFDIKPRLTSRAATPPATWWEQGLALYYAAFLSTEERLRSFLFSSDFFFRVKEWKATLTYRWFGRTDHQTTVTPDGRQILYYWDTDSTRITSSFNFLPDSELEPLVAEVNRTQDHYRAIGFDSVYLALIPNKTSIVAPTLGRYNRLIERVEHHPALRTPLVSVWKEFNQASQSVYLPSDTHWTCTGQAIWMEKVNGVLEK